MKSIFGLFLAIACLSGLVLLVLIPSVFAEEKTATTLWQAKTPAEYLDGYPVEYSFNGCYVRPHSSGEGVIIDAYDDSWSWELLLHHIIIKKNRYGDAQKKESFWNIDTRRTDNPVFRYTLDTTTLQTNVFFVKCRDAARNLPLAVRKAFLGYYGLVSE
ncbi:MAG: hypothetical protein HY435_01210 [Candidatus Liptonbacteria bacterium]|nr:hypothetical protein [Candidatus Liptonbacteria bacterium]